MSPDLKPDIYMKISIISIGLSYKKKETRNNVVTAVTDIIVSS